MGRGGAIVTPDELVFPFGGSFIKVPNFVKIDQEM